MNKRKRKGEADQQEGQADDKIEADDKDAPDGPRKRPHVQLPWMKVPATYAPDEAIQVDDVTGMRSRLRTAVSAIGHSTLFPVQAVAWELLAGGLSSRHDLCINAPTGSGKTLAYTLPLLQRCLTMPQLKGTRALVIVPTRVLATQVHAVMSSLTAHLGQRVTAVLANGSTSTAAEAAQLSGTTPASHLLSLLPAVTRLAGAADPPPAGAAAADIAVVTPGRLVHHLEAFGTLWRQSVEVVVVDEADRLLRQFYHGWLPALRAALSPGSSGASRRVLQILVSATLTHDPAKLAQFQLQNPRYIDISARPEPAAAAGSVQLLQELQIVTAAHSKPQALVALLCELRDAAAGGLAASGAWPGVRAIVFASAVDVTRRLAALLRGCAAHLQLSVHEISSRVSAKAQAAVLEGLPQTSGW
eukprot:jgi/Ulvmu1/10302/UM060_0104.1